MEREDSQLLKLAASILEGGEHDWDEIEKAAADDEHRRLIQRLKVLWEIARVHRNDYSVEVPAAEGVRRNAAHDGSTWTAPPADQQPLTMGDFRIVRRIGQGGMGVVYEAEQQHPKRPVALKVIRGGSYVDDNRVRLFQREAQTLARLKHPSIAAIYEAGCTDDGQHFFAMELVRGETLSEYMQRRSAEGLPLDELRSRLALFRKICDGVSYAHQRGVIHRDLKPSNILVLREASSSTTSSTLRPQAPDIKILDFGLARITDSDVAVTTIVTDLGRVQGTLPYMSPEQVRGNPDEIDLRTDVYSLGVLLYELISGQLPYDVKQSHVPEAIRVICEQPPRPLGRSSSGARRLDTDVTTIVQKALEKEPARRYQSAAALAEDIQRYLTDQPILAHPPSALYQFRKLVARHKAPFGLAAALFVLLAAFGATMAMQAGRVARERDRANHERDRANREAQAAQKVSSFLVDLFQVLDPSESRGNTITAREILDQGSERIDRELRDQPSIRAKLMHTMANVYNGLGLPERARPLLERAVSVMQESLPESPDLARSLGDLGTLYAWNGRANLALPLLQRSLAIRRKLFRPDDPAIGYGLAGLANYYVETRDQAAATTYYEQAVAILEHSPDAADQRQLSWCWNDLGVARLALQDTAGARSCLERALKIKQSLLPPDHPDVAKTAGNLGYLMVRTGEYEKARPLLESVLALREKIFGPQHAQTADALEALGEMWWRKGDPVKARPLLERAIAIRELYPAGPDLTDLYVLAATWRDLGRYRDSEALFKRALAMRDKATVGGGRAMPLAGAIEVAPDSPDVARCLQEYATLLRATGRAREAEGMEARAREILQGSGRQPAHR